MDSLAKNKKGIFVTFEGTDGAGKSTQIAILKEYLESLGREIIITREPGGTPISEKIRELILDKKNAEMTAMCEALLYAASRAQHVAEVIAPAIESGKIVICDRFIDSSIAYQSYGRDLGDAVLDINRFAIDEYMPDVTFLLMLEPEASTHRIEANEKDRIELEAMDFHQKVFEGYKNILKKYPDRVVGIDASRTIEEIASDIKEHVAKIILSHL